MDQTIIIATKNKGKAKEFEELFNNYGYKIKTLLDFKEIEDIPETGTSFAENAFQKASVVSEMLHTIVLADDSGLEVKALDGAPGIYSARFAGEHGNDQKNNQKLLSKLKNKPYNEREANFHCSLVIVGPNRPPLHVSGNVYGYILEKGKGNNGFGYDPLFYLPALNKTMAEIPSDKKNEISHRAQAIKKLKGYLDEWL